MLDLTLEERIKSSHPEIAEQHEEAQLGVFPTLQDRVNVLTRLKMLGVKEVRVTFSGGGDDGSIDDVEAVSHQDTYIDLTEELISGWEKREDYHQNEWIKTIKRIDNMKLTELLKEMCQDALEETGLDWYNNSGGEGALTIDFTESPPKINLEVGIRIEEIDEHNFSL